MDYAKRLAAELSAPETRVAAAIALIDEGNTIPFIARYRKEATGAMDDQLLRTLADRLEYLRGLDKRKEEVRTAIEAQGALTEELSAKLESAATLAEVEDLYRPYKPKRKTRASIARARGLQPRNHRNVVFTAPASEYDGQIDFHCDCLLIPGPQFSL